MKTKTMPWLVFVESPSEGGGAEVNPGDQATEDSTEQAGKGYPKGIPVSQMTTEQRAAYDAAKSAENAIRREVWAELKSLTGAESPEAIRDGLAELQRRRESEMTAQEKAVNSAREEARQAAIAEARQESVGVLLRAAMTARGASADDVTDVLAALDKKSFVVADGIDHDRIIRFAERMATTKPLSPDMGMGRRGPGMGPSKAEQGREAARRRYNLGDK